MHSAQDDTVELMDNVEDVKETMTHLGLSQETYSNLHEYNEAQKKTDQVIEVMKYESEGGTVENQEKIYQEFMRKFQRQIRETSETALQHVENNIKHLPRSLFDKFLEKPESEGYAENFVAEVEEKLFTGEKDQWPEDEHEAKAFEEYNKFLYDDPIDSDASDEEFAIRKKIHDTAMSVHGEEVKHIVHSRR